MNSIKDLTGKLNQKRGEYNSLIKDIEVIQRAIKVNELAIVRHTKAREILKLVGLQTQQELEYHISSITSLAMQSVFGEGSYNVLIEFVQRRNKTECDILFERDGEKFHPLDSSGGGAVDVAAFALRIASWSMQSPRTRNVIILDEPFRFLSTDNQEKASQMIKEVSNRLGIQFIIITHEEMLTLYADKVFTVKNKKGKSKIE